MIQSESYLKANVLVAGSAYFKSADKAAFVRSVKG